MSIETRSLFIRNQDSFYPVIAFDPESEKLFPFDFTAANTELTAAVLEDTALFSEYVNRKLQRSRCRFGIGGYGEYRTVYSRSRVFDPGHANDEPRRFHLGTDIWGPANTPVYAALGGMVHSFAFNDNYGDYGATLILSHQLDGCTFYTLYGHISLRDIEGLQEGQYIIRAQQIARFGKPHENGNWPPHLHFQIILDMGVAMGDYPGVCRFSERERYLANCPDPDLILRMNRFL